MPEHTQDIIQHSHFYLLSVISCFIYEISVQLVYMVDSTLYVYLPQQHQVCGLTVFTSTSRHIRATSDILNILQYKLRFNYVSCVQC